ncbi:MAG: class I SAM-dependent methyltransferase [Gammaproteobacteria bacterium]|nr:class I SAM-dependent methyltransferase [Gammaproteobacteria bacterium]
MMDIEQPHKRLAGWYQTVAGQNLLHQENTLINKAIEGLFGYHLVMLGALDYAQGMAGSPISHKIVMNDEQLQQGTLHLRGSQYALPLQTDSVDVVVMPHLLEYSQQPHHVLREVERVTRPDGYIVILGFNPVSYYGICRALLGFKKRMPWQGHYYHPVRLRDWIQLLGFRIMEIKYCGFIPPISHEATQQHLGFLEKAADSFIAPLGSVYMIVARNQTVTPSVVRPAWKNKRAKLNGVVEPTTRMRNRN